MSRGTTARTLLALLGVTLLALQLVAPARPFASAHTFGRTLTGTETGITLSAPSGREGADTVRAPGRTGEPAGLPHAHHRHRGTASGWTQQHPLVPGRTTGTALPASSTGPHRHASRASRERTAAALQVFRC
ncbi:hypothetical protein [Streptomyces sp. NPDC006193]|uniref:hypothetical protein n=1 Tax=Streptomyces sp. NPDC006193 TaxID=3155717 RepID=UPI0033B82B11